MADEALETALRYYRESLNDLNSHPGQIRPSSAMRSRPYEKKNKMHSVRVFGVQQQKQKKPKQQQQRQQRHSPPPFLSLCWCFFRCISCAYQVPGIHGMILPGVLPSSFFPCVSIGVHPRGGPWLVEEKWLTGGGGMVDEGKWLAVSIEAWDDV